MGGLFSKKTMTDPYTYLAKPTGANYTNINAQGKEQYNQASLTYDDVNTFYDGVDQNAYIKIAKPTGTPYTNIPKPI